MKAVTYQKIVLNMELSSSVKTLKANKMEVLPNGAASSNHTNVANNASREVEELPGTTSVVAIIYNFLPTTIFEGLRNFDVVGVGSKMKQVIA